MAGLDGRPVRPLLYGLDDRFPMDDNIGDAEAPREGDQFPDEARGAVGYLDAGDNDDAPVMFQLFL